MPPGRPHGPKHGAAHARGAAARAFARRPGAAANLTLRPPASGPAYDDEEPLPTFLPARPGKGATSVVVALSRQAGPVEMTSFEDMKRLKETAGERARATGKRRGVQGSLSA